MDYKLKLGQQMGQVFKGIGGSLSAALKIDNVDITLEQLVAMEALAKNESMIQTELAEKLRKDKSNVLRMIDSLEQKLYVVRITDKEDKRRKNLILTKKGHDVLVEALNIEAKIISEILDGFDAEELTILNMFIDKMKKNLQK